MAPFKRGGVWWYKFYFAGQLIRESSKSTSKTVAKNAEQERRRELEAGFNNLKDIRQQRIRSLEDIGQIMPVRRYCQTGVLLNRFPSVSRICER